MKMYIGDRIKEINNLILSGETEKAKKKCLKQFYSPKFVSLYVKALMAEHRYEEAERICLNNLKTYQIMSQYISLLIIKEDYETALKFCEKHGDIEELQAQHIIVLSKFDKRDKIRKIGVNYPYNRYVSKSYAIALFNWGEYEEALKVCERHKYDQEVFDLYNQISAKANKNGIDSEIYYKIMEYIENKEYEKAKNICKCYIGDKKIFELYLIVLEKERISKPEKRLVLVQE